MWIYADQAWLSLQAFKIGRIALVVNLGNTSNRGSIGGGGRKGRTRTRILQPGSTLPNPFHPSKPSNLHKRWTLLRVRRST